MGPASSQLEWVLAAVAVGSALMVGVVVWRSRTRNYLPSRTRLTGAVAMSVALVAVAQVATVGAVGVGVNRSLGIYLDWHSLVSGITSPDGITGALGVGDDRAATVETAADRTQARRDGWYPMANQPAAGGGSYRVYPVVGARSRLHQNIVVWVPDGVRDSDFSRLPVVMTLSGAYGSPQGFLKAARFGEHASALIAAHRVPRFLMISPMVNVDLPHDTECVDYPHGPQAFTWLADDARIWAHHRLKVSLLRSRWTVQGVSTGGYCAAKLHTLRPDAFAAGASVLGYFEPEPDQTTLNLATLLRDNASIRDRADVAWAIRHHTPPSQLRLLALSSPSDPQSHPQFTKFQTAMGTTRGVSFDSVPNMPHTNQSFGALEDRALPFLLDRGGHDGPATAGGTGS